MSILIFYNKFENFIDLSKTNYCKITKEQKNKRIKEQKNMTFYWNYSGQDHEYSDIPELLTIGLLEDDYSEYLFLLVKASENGIYISDVLNDTSSCNCWNSTHAQCLAYLVGSQTDKSKSLRKYSRPGSSFYGSNLSEGIPDEDGCTILNWMLALGADLTIENHYYITIMDILQYDNTLTSREKNINFKELVRSHFESSN